MGNTRRYALKFGSRNNVIVAPDGQRHRFTTPDDESPAVAFGLIQNFFAFEQLWERELRRAGLRSGFLHKPTALVVLPVGAAAIDKRAVYDSFSELGFRETALVCEIRALALGHELVRQAGQALLIDLGFGKVDLSVLNHGLPQYDETLRLGSALLQTYYTNGDESNPLLTILADRLAYILKRHPLRQILLTGGGTAHPAFINRLQAQLGLPSSLIHDNDEHVMNGLLQIGKKHQDLQMIRLMM